MNKTRVLILGVIILLVISNLYFITSCYKSRSQTRSIANKEKQMNEREAILDFTALFVEKILQTDREVDFETRLMLENKVRDLDRQEILDQWNKFTKSTNEVEAQSEVRQLLLLLIEEANV